MVVPGLAAPALATKTALRGGDALISNWGFWSQPDSVSNQVLPVVGLSLRIWGVGGRS